MTLKKNLKKHPIKSETPEKPYMQLKQSDHIQVTWIITYPNNSTVMHLDFFCLIHHNFYHDISRHAIVVSKN